MGAEPVGGPQSTTATCSASLPPNIDKLIEDLSSDNSTKQTSAERAIEGMLESQATPACAKAEILRKIGSKISSRSMADYFNGLVRNVVDSAVRGNSGDLAIMTDLLQSRASSDYVKGSVLGRLLHLTSQEGLRQAHSLLSQHIDYLISNGRMKDLEILMVSQWSPRQAVATEMVFSAFVRRANQGDAQARGFAKQYMAKLVDLAEGGDQVAMQYLREYSSCDCADRQWLISEIPVELRG